MQGKYYFEESRMAKVKVSTALLGEITSICKVVLRKSLTNESVADNLYFHNSLLLYDAKVMMMCNSFLQCFPKICN